MAAISVHTMWASRRVAFSPGSCQRPEDWVLRNAGANVSVVTSTRWMKSSRMCILIAKTLSIVLGTDHHNSRTFNMLFTNAARGTYKHFDRPDATELTPSSCLHTGGHLRIHTNIHSIDRAIERPVPMDPEVLPAHVEGAETARQREPESGLCALPGVAQRDQHHTGLPSD
jgi:hypothetical protein